MLHDCQFYILQDSYLSIALRLLYFKIFPVKILELIILAEVELQNFLRFQLKNVIIYNIYNIKEVYKVACNYKFLLLRGISIEGKCYE